MRLLKILGFVQDKLARVELDRCEEVLQSFGVPERQKWRQIPPHERISLLVEMARSGWSLPTSKRVVTARAIMSQVPKVDEDTAHYLYAGAALMMARALTDGEVPAQDVCEVLADTMAHLHHEGLLAEALSTYWTVLMEYPEVGGDERVMKLRHLCAEGVIHWLRLDWAHRGEHHASQNLVQVGSTEHLALTILLKHDQFSLDFLGVNIRSESDGARALRKLVRNFTPPR